jgi:RimJ/RimL family protein N-acetyltransferase
MKSLLKFLFLVSFLVIVCRQVQGSESADIFASPFESARLRFYPMSQRFHDAVGTMWQDPKVIKNWETGEVIDAKSVPPRMQRYEKREQEKQLGWRAIVTKQGEDFVGIVGAFHEGNGLVQICYCIRSQYHRNPNKEVRGYGEEAVKGLLFYVLTGLPTTADIYAPIKESNEPSRGLVTAKIGMQVWDPPVEIKAKHPDRLFYNQPALPQMIYNALKKLAPSNESSADRTSLEQILLKDSIVFSIADYAAIYLQTGFEIKPLQTS